MIEKITSPELSEPFTYLQMNFWAGRLYYPIDRFLKREKADIFSSQEMVSGNGTLSPDSWTAESLIAEKHFDQVSFGLPMPYNTRNEIDYTLSLATFIKNNSEFEIENHIELYKDKNDLSKKEHNFAAYYSLLHTKVILKDGSFVHILNHHGRLYVCENSRLGTPVPDYNFKKIAEYAATLSGPIILSGDFNLIKEARSFQPLKDMGFINLNDVHDISVGRNEFAWKTEEAVSHIFVNDQVVVDEYRIPTDNVSDHLPIVLKCRVKR